MNSRFTLIILGIIVYMQGFIVAYSHPLDVSNTTLTLQDNKIYGVTYIHPVELDRILVSSGGISPTKISVESYYSLTGVLTDYLAQTIQIIDDDISCNIGEYSFQEGLMIDEIYSAGFPISYVFTCQEKIETPMIRITFMNEVPLQTNRLYIYRTINGVLTRTDYKVLNAQKDSHILSLVVDGVSPTLHDSDNDGLSDEDEVLYNTNPNNLDTDGDGYSDMIELQSSWNPTSRELSPGQRPFSRENSAQDSGNLPMQGQSNSLMQDTSVWGGARFTNILRDIRLYVESTAQDTSKLYLLLFSVGVLGFLHALGPGHSKGILISQIIDDAMSYSKSIVYCGVFTLIHLIDIVVVVVITKVFFSVLDPSVYVSTIGKISAILVVIIGVYIFYTTLKKYGRKSLEQNYNTRNTDIETNSKNHIYMAIITGLTPCAFGWSIFLMLLAMGKLTLAPPLLLSLGVGIFLCLFIIATITWFLRQKIYTFSPKISVISPMISATFIIFIGFGLIINNF